MAYLEYTSTPQAQMKELLIRSVSGILYVVLITFSAFYSELFFTGVIFLFSALALFEFQRLIAYNSPIPLLFLALLFYGALQLLIPQPTQWTIIGLAVLSNSLLWLQLKKKKTTPYSYPLKAALTFFYLTFSCFSILSLYQLSEGLGPLVPIFVYSLIWINNSFAYLVGKKWGKRHLFPAISPKKTWEGFMGGLLFCVIGSGIYYQFQSEFALWKFIVMGLCIATTATVGDLIQSKFKRIAQVKDSGSLIPGHGGFFDRMDSIIFSAPFVYCILYFFIYVS